MRKPAPRRKTPDRRQGGSGAWMLGGALPDDRRAGPRERRRRLRDRRRRI